MRMLAVYLVRCSMSELISRVNEQIAKSISQLTCILMNELSDSLIKVVSLISVGDFN